MGEKKEHGSMEKKIPVVVVKQLTDTRKILSALREYGIRCAEITFRTDCAAEAIRLAVKEFPDMEIGAGTVIDGKQCEKALASGAKFIVSPGLSVEVAEMCKEKGVPYYPGLRHAYGNYAGFVLRNYHGKILSREYLRRLKSVKGAFRAVPAGQIYSHGRRK